MSQQSEGDKRIAYAVVKHLQQQASLGTLSPDGKEGVEGKTREVKLYVCLFVFVVAIQCICEAYEISVGSERDREQYDVKPTLEVSHPPRTGFLLR